MVDATPIDLGRDILLLKEVSQLSGVKIVASTGFYYLQSIEAFNNTAEELAEWLINECKSGICFCGWKRKGFRKQCFVKIQSIFWIIEF